VVGAVAEGQGAKRAVMNSEAAETAAVAAAAHGEARWTQ
jgi:hypothetical protein